MADFTTHLDAEVAAGGGSRLAAAQQLGAVDARRLDGPGDGGDGARLARVAQEALPQRVLQHERELARSAPPAKARGLRLATGCHPIGKGSQSHRESWTKRGGS